MSVASWVGYSGLVGRRWVVFILVLLILWPVHSYPQATTGAGSIEGLVTDATGAVVPSAEVGVRNLNTGATRTSTTDGSGRYFVLSLPPGQYEVTAKAEGFRTAVQPEVTIVIGRTAVVDFGMALGLVTETVTVVDTPPLVESANATIGEVIQNEKVVTLPLNGRSYTQLALLIPGVTYGGTGSGIGAGGRGGVQNNSIGANGTFSISGSRPELNQFTFNGANVTNEFVGGTFVYPPIDSIQEFKIVQNNYSAEFGGRTGQVILTSRAGANDFHGSLYEFLRNDKLDANTFFGNRARQPRRPLKQNQFGAALGGPIVRDKTFFFFNWEAARIRRGVTQTTTVPTALMRDGDLSQLNKVIRDPSTGDPFQNAIVPAVRIEPIARNIITKTDYPLPNLDQLQNNFTQSPSSADDLNQYSLRLDHDLSDKDKLWGSYFFSRLDTSGRRFTQIVGSQSDTTSQSYTLSWTRLQTTNVINDFKAGFNFVSADTKNLAPANLTNADLGFPNNSFQPTAKGVSGGIPSFSPSGYGGLGAPAGPPQLFKTRHFQIGDTVNWISGAHVMRFGVDITREHQDQRFNPQIRGNYSFGNSYTNDGWSDFLLGFPSQVIREILNPVDPPDLFESLHRGTHYYFFAQDDWKVSPNLTLNLGLRYEFNSPVVEVRNRHANFIPRTVDGVGRIVRIQAPDSEFGRCLCRSAKNDWGPRFGLAYRPGGSDKTVIRTGYGIFYAYVPYNTKQTLAFNAPWIDRQFAVNTVPQPSITLANPFRPELLQSSFSGFAHDLDFLDGMIQQWNFNVQRQVAKSTVVDLSYVGNLSVHLDTNLSQNVSRPGPGPHPPRRPFPNERSTTWAQNWATASYHAFTAKIKREFSEGFTFLAHYTRSKSLDNASSQLSDKQDHENLRANKGPSGFDVADRFVSSWVYELPFGQGKKYLGSRGGVTDKLLGGWAVTGIYTLQSGFWFSPSTSSNTANVETGGLRPDRIRDGNLPTSERTITKWFDTGAFVQPGPFLFGNAGRNFLEAPGMKNFDLGLLKNTSIAEGHAIQFRAEFFNTWNNVNFGFPASNIVAGNVGTISSAGLSREIQFGLKYLF